MSKPLDKQIAAIVKKVTDELTKTVKSKSFYDEIGEEISNQIRKRTRLGYGISGTDTRTKLLPTKRSTQLAKERKKKAGTLSKLTTPKRSNLTDTGQLLDSIEYKSTTDKTTIQFDDGRRDSEIGNKKLAQYVQDQGRKFFGLTAPEKNQLRRLIEKKIQEMVKRLK